MNDPRKTENGPAMALALESVVLLPGATTKARLKNLRGLVKFWKTEAREWRRLYEKQRGGKAFDLIQAELTTARQRIRFLEQNVEISHDRERNI